MKKLILSLIVASLTAAASQASQVTWGTPDLMNGVGSANGTPLPFGDIVLLGNFNISNAQITANATNESFLMSHFTQFGTSAIGNGTMQFGSQGQGYWITGTTNASNTLGIQNTQIYYWVFNATTAAAASQYGIFTAPGNSSWIFPDDTSIVNTVVNDISQVPHDATGILFGSYGTGTSGDAASPLYDLAAIPEPSTVGLIVAGLAFLPLARLRRRQVA